MRTLTTVLALLVLIAGAITGCAQPYYMKTKFVPGSTDWAKGKGTATIKGEAFMMTMRGTPRTCAGRSVTLVPATAYTAEVVRAQGGRFVSTVVRDPNEIVPTRLARCNARGEFVFLDLPAGDWIVMSTVFWSAGSGLGSSVEGGMMHEVVTTRDNQESTVILAE